MGRFRRCFNSVSHLSCRDNDRAHSRRRTMRVKSWARALTAPFLLFILLGTVYAEPHLGEAIKSKDKVAVRALLQQRVNVNARDVDGTTALHWAAHLDDVETLNLLISAGANSNASDRQGVTPLSLACTNGNVRVV